MNAQPVTCAEAQPSLGVLVLGALDPAEREPVEAHVRGCAACSAILNEIAPLPGLLNRVDLSAADLEAPPEALLNRALAAVSATDPVTAFIPRPNRWRPFVSGVLVAAAAVGLFTVGLVIGHRFSPGSAASGSGAVTVQAASAPTKVSASVVMTPVPTGTRLAMTLSGVRPGEHCQLVAVARGGAREVSATWVATYEGGAEVTGNTALTLAEIVRLEVTTPTGDTLLLIPVPV